MSPRKYGLVSLVVAVITLSTVVLIAQEPALAASKASPGTTISVTKTAQTHLVQKTDWGIAKTVSPTSVNLFTGDSVVAHYQITATKTVTQVYRVQGQICVTNGGPVATQNLVIFDHVQYKVGSGQYLDVGSGATKTITPSTQIPAGQTVCYPYKIDFAAPVPNATYRNAVDASITNHSGTLGTPYPTSYRVGIAFPSTPDVSEGYNSINVSDTNGGSYPFSASGSQSYTVTYSCDTNDGINSNTATITQTGQTASTSITLNCYALEVTKDADTSFARTWTWQIDKSGEAKTSASVPTIHYTVDLTPTSADSDFSVSGNIKVHNPASISAKIISLSDVVSGPVSATVDCGTATFPYSLASGGDLDCTYSANLPNANSRTNTATATLQNRQIDSGVATELGTTDFTGSHSVTFGSTPSSETDECVSVSDHNSFTDSTSNLGTFCAADSSHSTSYDVVVGTDGCGTADVTNTATFTTNDSGTTGSDSVTMSNSGLDGGALCEPWREPPNPPV